MNIFPNESAQAFAQHTPNKLLDILNSLLKKGSVISALALSTLTVTGQPAKAYQDCPSSIYNRADKYVGTVVRESDNMFFALPMNLRTEVGQCTYFPNEGTFTMNVETAWNHPWVEDKPYYANLKITSSSNGGWKWELLDYNPNLFQHLLTIEFFDALSE